MKKENSNGQKILKIIVIFSILVFCIQLITNYVLSAYSTFSAKGEYTITEEFSPKAYVTQSTEEPGVINVTVTAESECYVRVRVVGPTMYNIQFSGEDWYWGGDEYYYYASVLSEGQSSSELIVHIDIPRSGEVYTSNGEELNINIITLAEAAQIYYDEYGVKEYNGPGYMGWNIRKDFDY